MKHSLELTEEEVIFISDDEGRIAYENFHLSIKKSFFEISKVHWEQKEWKKQLMKILLKTYISHFLG